MKVNQKKCMLRMSELLLIVAATVTTAWAQEIKPGDKVTVIKWNAKFQVGANVVLTTGLGQNYVVSKINGDWLWIQAFEAYLSRADVVHYDHAIDHFTAAIRREPNSNVAYHNRAVVWAARGETDIAIGDYTEAIRLAPRNSGSYRARGNAWAAKGEYDKAITDYAEAIRLDPSDTSVYPLRAQVWTSKGDLDRAVADLSECVKREPQESSHYYDRAHILRMQRKYDLALVDLSTALSIAPNEYVFYAMLCEIHFAMKNGAEVLKAANRMHELQRVRSFDSNYFRGRAYRLLGRHKEALTELQADPKHENDSALLAEIAAVHAAQGLYKQAAAEFDRLLKSPDVGTVKKIPFILFLAGCPDDAFRDGERSLKLALDAKETSGSAVDLKGAKAAAYSECGDFVQAVAHQKDAISLAERQKLHETYITELKERLTLFESGKPYRLPVVKPTE